MSHHFCRDRTSDIIPTEPSTVPDLKLLIPLQPINVESLENYLIEWVDRATGVYHWREMSASLSVFFLATYDLANLRVKGTIEIYLLMEQQFKLVKISIMEWLSQNKLNVTSISRTLDELVWKLRFLSLKTSRYLSEYSMQLRANSKQAYPAKNRQKMEL